MANIRGIQVELITDSKWWAPSADKLYLGVYGEGGGREFRLNGNVSLDQTGEQTFLVLGTACCKKDHEIQVQYSMFFGDNDPLLNPIEISSVRYVYLRKETADSTSANDDVLVLEKASVLLCDGDGHLRRFRKIGHINFSDEVGLQHWLGETDPPSCRVTVVLKKIRHKKDSTHAAGKKWYFDFGAGINSTPDFAHAGTTNNGDFEINVGLAVDLAIRGCCGHDRAIQVRGKAMEKDLFRNDVAEWTRDVAIKCNKEPTVQTEELELTVQGQVANHRSKVTFVYEITSVCVD